VEPALRHTTTIPKQEKGPAPIGAEPHSISVGPSLATTADCRAACLAAAAPRSRDGGGLRRLADRPKAERIVALPLPALISDLGRAEVRVRLGGRDRRSENQGRQSGAGQCQMTHLTLLAVVTTIVVGLAGVAKPRICIKIKNIYEIFIIYLHKSYMQIASG
jgi:hypothetical protein